MGEAVLSPSRWGGVTALVAAVLLVLSFSRTPDMAHASGVTLAIDAEISDGACVDIDTVGFITIATTTRVAVCLDNPGSVPIAAFQYSIIYDDTQLTAPETADQAPSLDDNPDANAGATTYTSGAYPNHLGGGWACDGGVGAHPKGDRDVDTGPGQGEAYSGGCISAAGPNTLVEGPLGVVTFQTASSSASATLTLAAASITDDAVNEIGSCAPVQSEPMTCTGASIEIGSEMGLYFDLDTTDGACTGVQINPSRIVNAGTGFDVAICFKNREHTPEALVAWNTHVVYNDTIVHGDEKDGGATGTDDNPDASVGPPYMCNATMDLDGVPFSGAGQAHLGCGWPNYPSPPSGGISQGSLGVMHLETGSPGTTTLSYGTGSSVTPYSSGTGLTFSCNGSGFTDLFCYGASITVLCVQPDAECDGADDAIDNCLGLYNPDQFNTDSDPRDNGPLAPGDDATSMTTDALGNACDADDDNDGMSDADEAVHPVPGCPSSTAALNPLALDSDGDHHHDGWECANGSDPANPASDFAGTMIADADSDRVQDRWEMRGYNGSGGTTDSDGDGCHDLVEVASIDSNKTITQADYLAVARRALNIWAPNTAQDYVLDIDKNGTVADADRLFVTRAALLPDWLPKTCP